MTIRVLIADDHQVVSDGLAALINAQINMEVIACVSDGYKAVQVSKELKPDVVVMDVSMPEMNGIDATKTLRSHSPAIQVIILSMHSSPEYVHRALSSGAKGYLLKRSAGNDLIQAIQAACAGKHFFSDAVTDIVVNQSLSKFEPSGLTEILSVRERQVLQLLVESHTIRDIAQQLSLSPKTIETYRTRIYEKLGLQDLPQLVRFAIKHGITSID